MDPYRIMAQIAAPIPGKICVDEESLPAEDTASKAYALDASVGMRLLLGGAMCAAAALFSCVARPGVVGELILIGILTIAALVTLCDLKCLLIPWELSAALLPLGVAWQLWAFGLESLLAGTVAGALAWGTFALTDKLFAAMGRDASVGGGDRRMIAPIFIATGLPGGVYAAAAACLATLAVLVLLHVTKKFEVKGKDTSIPFGPTLSAMLLLGIAISAINVS